MMKPYSKILATGLVAVLLWPSVVVADLRIKRRLTTKGLTYDKTLYLRGARQREEMSNFTGDKRKHYHIAFVYQCDLKQFVWVDLDHKRYSVYGHSQPLAAVVAFNEPQVPLTNQDAVNRARAKSKGTLTETTTIVDTGERREMFGFTARHLRTFTTWEATPKTCEALDMKQEVDGWYIDLLYGVDCSPDLSGSIMRGTFMPASSCLSGYLLKHHYWLERKRVGPSSLGFPLSEILTTYDSKGQPQVTRDEVLELSSEELDGSLFSVPAGFVKVTPQVYRKGLFERLFSLFGGR